MRTKFFNYAMFIHQYKFQTFFLIVNHLTVTDKIQYTCILRNILSGNLQLLDICRKFENKVHLKITSILNIRWIFIPNKTNRK